MNLEQQRGFYELHFISCPKFTVNHSFTGITDLILYYITNVACNFMLK